MDLQAPGDTIERSRDPYSGGTVVVEEGGAKMNTDNEESFILDTERLGWKAER